ncbi:MAG: hypothetical protein ACFE9Z_13730 [Promethearchaeota archaeon]
MSKAMIWQYQDFIKSRKEKLVNMLISEIIFLKKKIKKTQNNDQVKELEFALNRLEFLLNKLKTSSSDIPEKDFDKIIRLIYGIFKDITERLNLT